MAPKKGTAKKGRKLTSKKLNSSMALKRVFNLRKR